MFSRLEGRQVFGTNPEEYDRARPGYPASTYENLALKGALGPSVATFEIGPGSGVATREVLRRGNSPYVAVESDERFVRHLRIRHPEIKVEHAPFEDAFLAEDAFDFGFAATSFHWLVEAEALQKVARLLRPGGLWAAIWNSFYDPDKEDHFHLATEYFLKDLGSSPSEGEGGLTYAIDQEARISALEANGQFHDIEVHQEAWTLSLAPEGVCRLYASYSQIARLEPEHRSNVLAKLYEVAEGQFKGEVERNMLTVTYSARRR